MELTGNFFQLGYVTGDLDRAMAFYQQHCGVPEFFLLNTHGRDSYPPGMPAMRVALAWKGAAMIELIEPVFAPDSIYNHCLRKDGGVMLHHLGYLLAYDQLAPLAEGFEAAGVPVPVRLENPGSTSILYADTRAQFGHFVEYVSLGDKSNFFDQVPRF